MALSDLQLEGHSGNTRRNIVAGEGFWLCVAATAFQLQIRQCQKIRLEELPQISYSHIKIGSRMTSQSLFSKCIRNLSFDKVGQFILAVCLATLIHTEAVVFSSHHFPPLYYILHGHLETPVLYSRLRRYFV